MATRRGRLVVLTEYAASGEARLCDTAASFSDDLQDPATRIRCAAKRTWQRQLQRMVDFPIIPEPTATIESWGTIKADATNSFHSVHIGSQSGTGRGLRAFPGTSLRLDRKGRRIANSGLLPQGWCSPLHHALRRTWVLGSRLLSQSSSSSGYDHRPHCRTAYNRRAVSSFLVGTIHPSIPVRDRPRRKASYASQARPALPERLDHPAKLRSTLS